MFKPRSGKTAGKEEIAGVFVIKQIGFFSKSQ
jgi:hypothetical protein